MAMPLFEYECAACGARFERLVRDSRRGAGECPSCGSRNVRKLMSAFAVTSASEKTCAGAPEVCCPADALCRKSCLREQ
jgi:putative FmdB family regulatory protein